MYHHKYLKYKTKYLELKKNNMYQKGGTNALEMDKWIDYHKPIHLTKGELLKWKPGTSKDVLMLDRNFSEYHIESNLFQNKLYSPKEFFKVNKCKIKYNGDLTWDIEHPPNRETNCHNIEVNVEALGSKMAWCPLEDDKVSGCCKNKIKWNDLPDNIRIGWRGPMILWSDVKSSPKIYWKGIS